MPLSPEQEEALLRLAVGLPAEKRQVFLDGLCVDDSALRARLEGRLSSPEQTETALDRNAAAVETTRGEPPDIPEATGKTIGPYKLREKIGEGGCGVVYVADQQYPVRRRVALKVIKLGMDTRQVVARFELERQALAMMDHHNIAKVLDAGATQTGRPYFVMELVRGIRITDYCDQNKLSTHQRLDLFIQVCHAIQHAHQKGIIHRDALQEVLTLEGAGRDGNDLTGFSPDGSTIGVMSGDGILNLWHAPAMAEIRAAEKGKAVN